MANWTAKPVLVALAIVGIAGITTAGGLSIAEARAGWSTTTYVQVDGQVGASPATSTKAKPTPSKTPSGSPSPTTSPSQEPSPSPSSEPGTSPESSESPTASPSEGVQP